MACLQVSRTEPTSRPATFCALRLGPERTIEVVSVFAWSRLDVHVGLGWARFEADDSIRVEGHEVIVDAGVSWVVAFEVQLDEGWQSRRAEVVVHGDHGSRELVLESDGNGNWQVNGSPAPELRGCLDVDIAATPSTNTFVIRRLGLPVGRIGEVRVVWVSIPALEVAAVEQSYTHLEPRNGIDRYEYRSRGSIDGWVIEVDEDGVALDYEGFARRLHP